MGDSQGRSPFGADPDSTDDNVTASEEAVVAPVAPPPAPEPPVEPEAGDSSGRPPLGEVARERAESRIERVIDTTQKEN